MRRTMTSTLLWTLGILLVVFGVAWLGQRRLIYFPDRTHPSPPPDVEEVDLTTDDGLTLSAWWLVPTAPPDQAVIVFPGNAGSRQGRLPLARALVEGGAAVLLVDYRGYGGNSGSPSEKGLLADARAARRWLDDHHDGPVVYLGESIGSGPATALAMEAAPDVLVLRSPFPSLVEVARVHYRLLPAAWLLRDRFPVADQVGVLEIPVVVVAGSHDTVVPLELSRRVAEASDADLIVVEGADHNDPDLAWGPAVVTAIVDPH